MSKYRRVPAVVDARQWQPDFPIEGVKITAPDRGSLVPRGILRTQVGSMIVNCGDWVLTGEDGRMWVVEQDVFPALYEPVP